MKGNKIKWVGRALVFGVIIISLVTLVAMQLWNHIVVQIFSLPIITFWQMLGLLILSKIMFGGFPGRGCGKRWGGGGPPPFLRERWSQMNVEERKEWMKKMREGKESKD